MEFLLFNLKENCMRCRFSVIALSVGVALGVGSAWAQDYTVVLPTLVVEMTKDSAQTKGYTTYDTAAVTRTEQLVKETPHTIETINVQKNKNYGTNDLSSIVEGNAGVDASYDTRGESILIRGFSADSGDIYQDGIRSSGQVRRSSTNTERVEILKGPSAVLYGRGRGGGVINMVSKKANFGSKIDVGARTGSWNRVGVSADINQVLTDNLAVRINADYEQGYSYRTGVNYKNTMMSPSIVWRSDDGVITWEGQYTYDDAWRVPDRNPSKTEYDKMGVDYYQGFGLKGDFIKDTLHFARSKVQYDVSDNWQAQWVAGYRKHAQDFDNTYNGTFDNKTKMLRKNYAWQQTDNSTLSNSLILKGSLDIQQMNHQIITGLDVTKEEREPKLGFKRDFTVAINPYNINEWQVNTGRLINQTTHNIHKNNTVSAFIHDVVEVVPDLKVSVGGRFDRYHTTSTNTLQNTTNTHSGSSFSPSIGAVYDLTPNHNVYGSFAKSFAPYGSSGLLSVGTNHVTIDPEYTRQYELGLKSDWAAGKLATTVSIYHIDNYNKVYLKDRDDPYSFAVRGKDTSQGVDLSVLGQLASNLYVRGSLGVMNAKIVEDRQTPANENRKLSGTSPMQGNVFIRYLPTDNWFIETGITHSGKRYHYERDGAPNPLAGFSRLDIMAGYRYNNLNGTLALHNALDSKYWRSAAMPAPPRSVMLKVNYDF